MKIFLLSLSLLSVAVCTCEKEHTDPVTHEMAKVRGYQNWYIDPGFRCGLFVPENYSGDKSYPLIIYLHGYSDTTTWDLNWYHDPVTTMDPCIVLTPKCPREEIYGWGNSYDPRTSPMMEKTLEMLDLVEKTFNLDRNRYYIYGTSMGGFGTYGAIQKNPEMFAAGYVLCGNGNINMASILSSLPFWIFHGSEDPVVPVQPTRDLYNAILESGGKTIRYTEYPGVAHNVWDYTRYETTLQTWLLAQRKGKVSGAPDGLIFISARNNETGKVNLFWEMPPETHAVSDKNVWYSRIYRNGVVIGEVYNNRNTFTDTTVVVNTMYSYQISAVNYYFLESGLSAPVSVDITR